MHALHRASIAALLLLSSRPALAEEAQPAVPGEAPAPAPDLAPRPPAPLDFQLLDEPQRRLNDPAFEAAVARRRVLLTAHQATGLATWALMGATVVYGRLNYRDMYFGEGTEKYQPTHQKLAYATAATFAMTGLLALSAPEPYPKPMRLDTAFVHKSSMALATVGLVSQVVLGLGIRRGLGNLDPLDTARVHQAVGIGTFAAMSVGAITLVF